MSKISAERAALIARIKVAAAALEIPQEAIDHVVKHGSSQRRAKATKVLCAFAVKYGVSLDYLIANDLGTTFRFASLSLKDKRPKVA
jgi:hypothetical protein